MLLLKFFVNSYFYFIYIIKTTHIFLRLVIQDKAPHYFCSRSNKAKPSNFDGEFCKTKE